MKYLHQHPAPAGVKIYDLDHRIVPEARAMFCAMASRMPQGGIAQRYAEVVDAIAEQLWSARGVVEYQSGTIGPVVVATWERLIGHGGNPVLRDLLRDIRWDAEDVLTEYPLHPVVKRFADTFVGQYGHASIMELTGEPAVFVEGVSWWTAWLSFDGPLVKGQEFSTRAKAYKDWPMCAEAYEEDPLATSMMQVEDERILQEVAPGDYSNHKAPPVRLPTSEFNHLHHDWLEVFAAEVDWWTEHLSSAENRAALGIADKEPFRPAYDRARWALPGTIATGFAHTANVRDQSRVNRTALNFAKNSARDGGSSAPVELWEAVEAAYAKALPGFEGYALRAAVGQDEGKYLRVPGNLCYTFPYWGDGDSREVEYVLREATNGVFVDSTHKWGWEPFGMGAAYVRDGGHGGGYLDPAWNRKRLAVGIHCSLAVARDWHRHRTLMPWSLRPLMRRRPDSSDERPLAIHPAYEAKSDYAKTWLPRLLKRSEDTYRDLFQKGDTYRAILALPLGAECLLLGYGGVRDVVYMAELRANAHGANFEYKAQAEEILRQLSKADCGLTYSGDL